MAGTTKRKMIAAEPAATGGWSEIGKAYRDSLLAKLDRLRLKHFEGTLLLPLSEQQLELIEEVVAGGGDTLQLHVDECLQIVRMGERDLEDAGDSSDKQLCGDCGATAKEMVDAERGKARKGKAAPRQHESGTAVPHSKKRTKNTLQRRPVWQPPRPIRLADCVMHSANRQHAKDDLRERVVSLETAGQLEAIKVYQLTAGHSLVLGGWGRVLAARSAKWTQIEASVLQGMRDEAGEIGPPSEAELLAILAEDNSQRSDLTVFEKARLGKALEEAGYSTTEAARRVGFRDPSSLSNARKLLTLPEELASQVLLPREDPLHLPQAVARKIADYAHVPAIMRKVLEDRSADPDEWRNYPDDSLDHCVRWVVRPIDAAGARALGRETVPTIAQTAALETVKIPAVDRGERTEIAVTTQVEQWDQIALQTYDTNGQEEKPQRVRKAALTAEETRCREREKAEQLAKRRARWEYRWRHGYVVREIEERQPGEPGREAAIERLCVWAMAESHTEGRAAVAKAVESRGHCKGLTRRYSNCEECLSYVSSSAAELKAVRIGAALELLAHPDTGNPDYPHVPRMLVWQMCADLGFDVATGWAELFLGDDGRELLESLWNTHETSQLAEIVAANPGMRVSGEKKSDLVDALCETAVQLPEWLQDDAGAKKKKGR